MTTHPVVPARLSGRPPTDPALLARQMCEQASHLTGRFLSIRPELDREDGQWGVALALTWLVERAAEGTPVGECHGGELFWDLLACLRLPEGHEPGVVVDAAVGFVGFMGSTGLLSRDQSDRLRREARVEGLAYLAWQMGLLSRVEASERRRRYTR